MTYKKIYNMHVTHKKTKMVCTVGVVLFLALSRSFAQSELSDKAIEDTMPKIRAMWRDVALPDSVRKAKGREYIGLMKLQSKLRTANTEEDYGKEFNAMDSLLRVSLKTQDSLTTRMLDMLEDTSVYFKVKDQIINRLAKIPDERIYRYFAKNISHLIFTGYEDILDYMRFLYNAKNRWQVIKPVLESIEQDEHNEEDFYLFYYLLRDIGGGDTTLPLSITSAQLRLYGMITIKTAEFDEKYKNLKRFRDYLMTIKED